MVTDGGKVVPYVKSFMEFCIADLILVGEELDDDVVNLIDITCKALL